ncbi:MAG: aldo/keto reductase, partial [Anaerolineales bacterium]|nr:aldo/keto reductase [Anaerolineales bacterium]
VRRKSLEKQLLTSLPVIETLDKIAEKSKTDPAQVALSWLLHQGDDVIAIPGATRVEHVQESVGAMKLSLTEDDCKRLDEVSRGYVL